MRRPDARWASLDCSALAIVCALTFGACGEDDPEPIDAASLDARPADSARGDASATDGGAIDAGTALDGATDDTGTSDAAPSDARAIDAAASDAGAIDAAASDAGAIDAATADASSPFDGGAPELDLGFDGGPTDTGPSTGACVSGATGTHVVRFRWRGSGAGSTAYVDYEVNDLPDASRWHVSANDMSFGYRPVFDDIFLGEGGLDLEGRAFIDVELSTAGLSSIRAVTIAIYGRSFNTTASGSFSWQTFDGIGATETDLVSNVAPYSWYGGDATTELPPGDDGVLLRLRAGPSSDALIVNRVEICFDAS